jgi:hypothetical protein
MNYRLPTIIALAALLSPIGLLPSEAQTTGNTQPSKITIDPVSHVLVINGKKTFPIGFTLPPAPDSKAYNGKPALEEFRDAGAVFIRTGPMRDESGEWAGNWDKNWVEREKQYQDAAARAGMFCMPWLKELSAIPDTSGPKAQELRRIVNMFKNSPGMGIWKGEDEPQWGKQPIGPLVNAYKIIHELDPNHPVWIVQAPRGTIAELKPYNPSYDIGGSDIYPISYPPGTHVPADRNKEISLAGDYTRKMVAVVENKKPIWTTLQVAWSGVSRPGKNTLRFPTFPQERFMTYESIICGARGLVYFGGNLKMDMNEKDKALGWNWTFWQRVLRPVLEEIGDKSPLADALCAPTSKLPIKATRNGENIELTAREVGNDLYILACCKDPLKTAEVEFTGLPKGARQGVVMYEEPRIVHAENGTFKDWFAPWDVHVYKFSK